MTTENNFLSQFAEIHNKAFRKARRRLDYSDVLDALQLFYDRIDIEPEFEVDTADRKKIVSLCCDIVAEHGEEIAPHVYRIVTRHAVEQYKASTLWGRIKSKFNAMRLRWKYRKFWKKQA